MARTIAAEVAAAVQEHAKTASAPIDRPRQEVLPQDLMSSGSTLLNLGCSGTVRGAYKLGTIVTCPGSSSSGKSMLAETALAEAANDARFDSYQLIRDDAEAAYSFDTAYLFGEKTASRVEKPPNGCSNTIQHFSSNILTLTKAKKRCIYLLDSLDSLSTSEELEKEMKKALALAKSPEAAKEIAGSFNTEKAKILGGILRMINGELEKTRSLVIIVQQIRQKIGALAFQSPWTTSGGEAPFFYSQHQIWLNKIGVIKARERKIGTVVKAEVKKNKLTGKLRDCEFNIYYDYGIDDVGSMVDFLIKEGLWTRAGGHVNAPELGVSGTRPTTTGEVGTLVKEIEARGLEHSLRKLTGEIWTEIEESLLLHRKPRF